MSMPMARLISNLDAILGRRPIWQRKVLLALWVAIVWTGMFLAMTAAGETVIHG